ncbi:MAG: hypothetical protein LBS10_07020 [Gracilibacteraceae bacterium]|jgi:ABC-type transport system substrate-binding protein|nr:hypothetical protein [Gracilibacteraceae bacterium]
MRRKLKQGAVSGIRERVAAIIQQNLAEVGVTVEIVVADGTTMFAGLRDGSLDTGLITWTTLPANPIYYQNLLSPNVVNHANIRDDTYVPLINAINAEQDREKRVGLVKQIEALLAEHAAYVPLYHEHTFVLRSPRVEGLTIINTEAPWEWRVND